MFDQMKAMGALAGLLKDKEKMQRIAEEFQEKLERISVIGTSGGGAVRVTVSGKMRVTEVFLDPSLVAGMARGGEGDGGREMAESLVREATNEALLLAQQRVKEEAQRISEDLGVPEIPGMDRMLGGS